MASGKYVECTKSELDLFSLPYVQTSMLKTQEVAYKTIASLDNASSLEFVSIGQGDTYRDLSNIYLKLRLKITKSDGTAYPAAAAGAVATGGAGIINNFMHSLFRQCTITLGNTVISQSDSNYAYRAYIESVLNYNYDAMSTHQEAACFYPDTAKQLDNITDGKNVGLDKRKAMIKDSVEFELIGRLHADMLNQQKYLLNNVDMRIMLSLQKDEFYMLEADTNTSKAKITEATLYMNHVTINPAILLAHESVLARSNAFYPYTRVEVKNYTIPAGSGNLSLDNVVIGKYALNSRQIV